MNAISLPRQEILCYLLDAWNQNASTIKWIMMHNISSTYREVFHCNRAKKKKNLKIELYRLPEVQRVGVFHFWNIHKTVREYLVKQIKQNELQGAAAFWCLLIDVFLCFPFSSCKPEQGDLLLKLHIYCWDLHVVTFDNKLLNNTRAALQY